VNECSRLILLDPRVVILKNVALLGSGRAGHGHSCNFRTSTFLIQRYAHLCVFAKKTLNVRQ
jgi:hypothetical protein